MSPIWLWRPHLQATPSGVREKDYRCCCWIFPSPSGFPVYNYILLAVELGLLSVSIVTSMKTNTSIVPPQTWMNMTIWASMTVLGIISSRTLRPFWMQIYLILSTILFVIGFFGACVLLIASLVLISIPRDQYGKELEEAITRGLTNNRHQLGGTIYLLIFCMIVVVWQAQLTYSFYFYVRDRQLEVEARAAQRNTQNVSGSYEKDAEKQELLPPPYDQL